MQPDAARPAPPAWARGRVLAAAAVVAVVAILGVSAVVLTERSLARLELVDARLRETGRFTEARARLQRYVVQALPPALPPDDALVVDFRLQIDQARSLGERLPDDVRRGLDQLALALRRPLVTRSDLLAAAVLLEDMASAESAVHARIFDEARGDARTELAAALAVLGVLGVLTVVGLWAVPERAVDPFRRRLRESTRALLERERALARAQQMARLGEAAAVMAHEVRNPLAGVSTALQNLSREREDLAPRLAPLLGEMERATRTLRQYLGRIHGPPAGAERVDVASVVHDLAELLAYQAPRGVRIRDRVFGPLHAQVPPDALRQVVLNLGLNAMEAMEARGGDLVFAAEEGPDGPILSVLDEGPGFPEAVLGDRADPFVSGKEGGTGIGLRVVRRLVAEMGGTLTLTNRSEGGARADIALPAAAPASTDRAGEAP